MLSYYLDTCRFSIRELFAHRYLSYLSYMCEKENISKINPKRLHIQSPALLNYLLNSERSVSMTFPTVSSVPSLVLVWDHFLKECSTIISGIFFRTTDTHHFASFGASASLILSSVRFQTTTIHVPSSNGP